MNNSVLLDTSFFIRLLNDENKLHKNALDYYKYFLNNNVKLRISTISIAEYLVKGQFDDLPWKNIQVLPFNLPHSKKSAEFARIIFSKRNQLNLPNRLIIPNDTNLFARADVEADITHFITSDSECIKMINSLSIETNLNFSYIDINIDVNDQFGMLNFT
jgi:predicted nucleic acid-binding protein